MEKNVKGNMFSVFRIYKLRSYEYAIIKHMYS